MVTYRRKYYYSNINNLRLTIDEDIEYQIIYSNNICNNFKKTCNEIILELKYNAPSDYKLIESDLRLPFLLSKNSKYVNGISEFEKSLIKSFSKPNILWNLNHLLKKEWKIYLINIL